MTKSNVNSTANSNLVKMKLAVVTYHKGDENEYVRKNVAADACYASGNSIPYKQEQIDKQRAILASLLPVEGQEVPTVKLERTALILKSMNAEMDELQERHAADLEVYKLVTGEDYMKRPKSTGYANADTILAEAKALLA